MKTHVEFQSDKFPSYKNEDEGVNWDAGIFGKRLAEYLVERFPKHGIEVADHLAEDWGWYIELKHDGAFTMFVGCAGYDEPENGFHCFVEPSKPFVRSWFKKIETTAHVTKVTDALQNILASDPDIRSIRWRDENEK
jgi:hypothetical protein